MTQQVGYIVRGSFDHDNLPASVFLKSVSKKTDAEKLFRDIAKESGSPTNFLTRLLNANNEIVCGIPANIFTITANHDKIDRIVTLEFLDIDGYSHASIRTNQDPWTIEQAGRVLFSGAESQAIAIHQALKDGDYAKAHYDLDFDLEQITNCEDRLTFNFNDKVRTSFQSADLPLSTETIFFDVNKKYSQLFTGQGDNWVSIDSEDDLMAHLHRISDLIQNVSDLDSYKKMIVVRADVLENNGSGVAAIHITGHNYIIRKVIDKLKADKVMPEFTGLVPMMNLSNRTGAGRNIPRPYNIKGAPFSIGAHVSVRSLTDPNTLEYLLEDSELSTDEYHDELHDILIGAEGTIQSYDYDCGCGQIFPNQPMIAVKIGVGKFQDKVIEFWPEELVEILGDSDD